MDRDPGDQDSTELTSVRRDGFVVLPNLLSNDALPRDLEAETNVIWALDDFTADNGATVVAPGSHTWPSGRHPGDHELVPVVMPAGSAFVYSGRLWHGAGHNRSDSPVVAEAAPARGVGRCYRVPGLRRRVIIPRSGWPTSRTDDDHPGPG